MSSDGDPSTTFQLIRAHMAPGFALAAKLSGQGAIEVAADGAELTLSDGRTLVDFGSYAVTLAGHRPPEVVSAVRGQLDRLPTSTRMLANDAAPRLAAELVDLDRTGTLYRVWFGLNGSDAVEVALKLAYLVTGRQRAVALEGGYHGKSLGALAVTHGPRYRQGLETLLDHVVHVPLDLDQVERILATNTIAAFIFEPIQGEGGVVPLDPSVLLEIERIARSHGTLLIADEIQMGLLRGGSWLLSQDWGLAPDAVLLGKVLGGGVMPLSAMLCTEEMFAPLKRDPFVHSLAFSGHPLACAAGLGGLAALRRLEHDADSVEALMTDMLAAVLRDHGGVLRSARGRGLVWGIEAGSVELAGHVVAELAPAGLIHSPGLGRPDAIRLLPPLVATEEHVERARSALVAGARAAEEASRLGGGAPWSVARQCDAAGVTRIEVTGRDGAGLTAG